MSDDVFIQKLLGPVNNVISKGLAIICGQESVNLTDPNYKTDIFIG